MAQALQQRGYDIHILTSEPISHQDLSIEIREDIYQGIPVTYLAYDYMRRTAAERASYSDPLITAELQTVLQKLQPDLVHATSLSLLMAGLIEAATHLNLPFIYTATDYVLTCRRGTYFKRTRSICTIREELTACTTCIGPHNLAEYWLKQAWHLLPR